MKTFCSLATFLMFVNSVHVSLSVSQCEQPMEVGPCKMAVSSFYYNNQTGACTPFTYGGCEGNNNNFETMHDCSRACGGKCSLEKDGGICKAYFERYYYDMEQEKCMPFIYGGCGGNQNRFVSFETCEAACVHGE